MVRNTPGKACDAFRPQQLQVHFREPSLMHLAKKLSCLRVLEHHMIEHLLRYVQ